MASANHGPSAADVMGALATIQDPDLGRDVVSLGMIKDLQVAGSRVNFTFELTTPACPASGYLVDGARAALARKERVKPPLERQRE